MVCPGNLQVLTAATLYFDTGEEAQLKAMNTLMHFFVFSARFIHTFIPLIECSFALDLVLILRNPFADSAARTPKWLTATTLTAVLLATVVPVLARDTKLENSHEMLPRLLFFIIAVPALIYSLLFLRQPGLSQQFRKEYMRRQFIFLTVSFLIEVVLLLSSSSLAKVWIPTLPLWIMNSCASLFSVDGYILGLIRLTDPPVYKTIKTYFSSCGSAD